MAKILLAEDDAELNSVVRSYLLFEHHQVESAFNGADASALMECSDFDLMIFDWDLPQKSGIELVTQVRTAGKTVPILMITGKSKTTEKTTGLDSGADDYLTKPFPLDELGARVRALLRRSQRFNVDGGNKLSVAHLVLDSQRHRVSKDGEPIELLPKEFQLLEFFMRNANHVFAPEAIIRKVWPSDTEASVEAIRTTVKRLRKKIDPEGKILRTVHGVGYVLEQE